MKWLLLLAIRVYWQLSPKRETGRCLFRISCSRHVFRVTKKEGLLKGVAALRYRFRSCRGGYHIIDNPVHRKRTMVLCTGQEIPEHEIAVRLLGSVTEEIRKRSI